MKTRIVLAQIADPRLTEYRLTPNEVRRVNRINIARELGCLPSEVDQMSVQDYIDILAVIGAERYMQERAAQRGK
jgi:hypothetical protein